MKTDGGESDREDNKGVHGVIGSARRQINATLTQNKTSSPLPSPYEGIIWFLLGSIGTLKWWLMPICFLAAWWFLYVLNRKGDSR